MHGMAGSAAVILLTFDAGTSALQGMLYILLFGIGSMLGMALLSVAISLPMRLFSRQLTWLHNGFQVLLGCLTIGIGVLMLFENAISLSI
jgi:cytochrome c biogenesis protein CcdA